MKPRQGSNVSFFTIFETDIGYCGLAWSEHGLTRFNLPEKDLAELEERLAAFASKHPPGNPLPVWVGKAIAKVQRHLSGKPTDLTEIPLDLTGVSSFHAKVYRASREIPIGTTVTYGELAATVCVPGAARAVGTALARNPIAVIVPCHRIVAASKRLGGFSAFGGLDTKTRLLKLEHAGI